MAATWQQSNRWAAILLVLSLLGLTLWLIQSDALRRIDNLVYDYFLTYMSNRISDDIVIVAIDDVSLSRLGRWPWSRRIHAAMLNRLSEVHARVIGYDVLFPEPQADDPEADVLLAEALERNGRTVLPVAPSNPVSGYPISEVLPIPILAASAGALGHVDLEVDIDGLSRRFCFYAGFGEPYWPAFAMAMARLAGGPENLWYSRAPPSAPLVNGWTRDECYLIPFDERKQAVKALSFYEVLESPELAQQLSGRYVLVGSIAPGLGDFLASPVSSDGRRMAGVELNAQILSGILSRSLVRTMSHSTHGVVTFVLAMLSCLLIIVANYPVAALSFVTTIVAILTVTGMLLFAGNIWFGPSAAIVPVVIGYPIWGAWLLFNARRLNLSLAGRIEHQALHHAATDLPNQFVLDDHLRALGDCNDAGDQVSALILVHIKWSASADAIVERSASESLLRAIAERLSNVVRGDDLVAHLSGDDFGILVEHLSGESDARRVANALAETLIEPIRIDDKQFFLTPRIGLSLWPSESPDGAALLRDAYIAMFRARIDQTTVPCLYSAQIAREVRTRSRLEQSLISAVEQAEFEVYYQPQVHATTNRIVGFEALLRWHNPELGLVYPGTFIPLAEHTGLIHAIGAWVLRTACQQMQQWVSRHPAPLRLAVNLSPVQFADDQLVDEVRAALAQSGLAAACLEVEITESAVMHDTNKAATAMSAIKALGVSLAIDDFGTGYSSLTGLQRFPVDRIKIDQSFTREIADNDDVREIILSIIGMAKRLRLEVVAEGVETQWQSEFLRKESCDVLQGYYFSHPMPAREITALLAEEASGGAVLRRVAKRGVDLRSVT